MKKGNTFIIVSILLTVGVFSLLSINGVFSKENINRNSTFNPHKQNRAIRLFEEVMSVDFENDYPQTVEEVLNTYLKTVELIYGNMIFDNDVLLQVVQQQRKMFTPNLLDANPEEEQFKNILESTKQLNKQNIVLVNNNVRVIEQWNEFFIAEVVQNYTSHGNVNITVFFENDNNYWKIASWQNS